MPWGALLGLAPLALGYLALRRKPWHGFLLLAFFAVLFGVALGGCHWMQRRAAGFKARSGEHFRRWQTLTEGHSPQMLPRPDYRWSPRARYHIDMFIKYFDHAEQPWLPVASDPTEPE